MVDEGHDNCFHVLSSAGLGSAGLGSAGLSSVCDGHVGVAPCWRLLAFYPDIPNTPPPSCPQSLKELLHHNSTSEPFQ
ncbi:hypothetical protein EYF80_031652 [Liparis tanakae]|uniref:Uncharacterized protein n=1 Tax=Liparis tanakae TaxID=230148 RepID=A0A4Z2GXE4_9TELE|nr:hypothetical protein EYF80_031652 [Liparis tanakae]